MAKFCNECGKEIAEDIAFCTECGTPIQAVSQSTSDTEGQRKTVAATMVAEPPKTVHQTVPPVMPVSEFNLGKGKYEPISTGGYIGIMLLMSIPIIGQILAIVWAFGGCRKINKRNFARAMLIFLVISLILGAIIYFVGRNIVTEILQNAELGGLMNELGGFDELMDLLKQSQ